MDIRLILTAFFVTFGITASAHFSHQEVAKTVVGKVNEGIENLRNLFDSIVKDDGERTDAYRRILQREAGREQQAFDKAKEDLRSARQKNVLNSDGKLREDALVFKREAGRKRARVLHARMEVDVPTRVPSRVDEVPVVLPKSWPTADSKEILENISAEVVTGSKRKMRLLLKNNRSRYLMPNRQPSDFQNFDRREHGLATMNYCEYEGRYVRKGTQKYIPETDNVAVCRSTDPLWISVWSCNVLLNTPEKLKSQPQGIVQKCIKLCAAKPGLNTKPPANVPKWQQRLNNASERIRTETPSTVVNIVSRRLKPLSPSTPVPKRGDRSSTKRVRTTLWDGEWNAAWNDMKFKPVTLKREEAALKAAGLWFTTAEPSAESKIDHFKDSADFGHIKDSADFEHFKESVDLRHAKALADFEHSKASADFEHFEAMADFKHSKHSKASTDFDDSADVEDSSDYEGSPSSVSRRMAYPSTTLPTMDDLDMAFFKPMRSTKEAGIQLIESETEASIPDSAEGGDGDFGHRDESFSHMDDKDFSRMDKGPDYSES